MNNRIRGIPVDIDDPDPELLHDIAEGPDLDPHRMFELRELILSSCESEQDRAIVELREQGFLDREIAGRLRISQTDVYEKRRAILGRFQTLNGEA